MVTTTAGRVTSNTRQELNEKIWAEMEQRIIFYAQHTELIQQRLQELDREWDVERLIETEGPSMTLMGILLSITGGRKWLLLPLFAQSMMLTHAIQGFYPLLPLFRAMGFRTQGEISHERYALRVLRGDFESTTDTGTGTDVRANVAFLAARIRPM